MNLNTVIVGCGDVGRRIAKQLKEENGQVGISALVQTQQSIELCEALGCSVQALDLDSTVSAITNLQNSKLYYLIPPQSTGLTDERSKHFIQMLNSNNCQPAKVVIISTTAVYGACDGEWVTETSALQPTSDRGHRRLDMEAQWSAWGEQNSVSIITLRVSGIYARSRLPVDRIKKGTPVVKADESGFTNRIHADDLASIAIAGMTKLNHSETYNATDGTPSTISDYLQQAAKVLNLPALPEITMQQAQMELSAAMLSYLSESRKISNKKMLAELGVELMYPDFRKGLLV